MMLLFLHQILESVSSQDKSDDSKVSSSYLSSESEDLCEGLSIEEEWGRGSESSKTLSFIGLIEECVKAKAKWQNKVKGVINYSNQWTSADFRSDREHKNFWT